jgi:hypothetical protein
MKFKLSLAVGIVGLLSGSCAWSQTSVREADLCEIAAHPESYNGQLVRVRGTLESTMETYVIAKADCAAIPLEHPESVKPQPAFALQRNADLKKLEKMPHSNSKQMECLGPCPSGPYYDPITATVVGRVDAVPGSAVQGPHLQRRGFGNRHGSQVRIIVKSYSNVEGHKRADPSKPDSSTASHEALILDVPSTGTARQPALPMVAFVEVALYPPIARVANVQGVVHLTVETDGHRVIRTTVQSGAKVLADAAEKNAQSWKFTDHGPTSFAVTYVYKLVTDIKPAQNNPRIILRLPTEVEIDEQKWPGTRDESPTVGASSLGHEAGHAQETSSTSPQKP